MRTYGNHHLKQKWQGLKTHSAAMSRRLPKFHNQESYTLSQPSLGRFYLCIMTPIPLAHPTTTYWIQWTFNTWQRPYSGINSSNSVSKLFFQEMLTCWTSKSVGAWGNLRPKLLIFVCTFIKLKIIYWVHLRYPCGLMRLKGKLFFATAVASADSREVNWLSRMKSSLAWMSWFYKSKMPSSLFNRGNV